MDQFVIQGGKRLRGEVTIGGAKNAALPIMAAALLGEGPSEVRGVPELADVAHLSVLLGELGVDIVRRNGFYETADFYGPAMLERFLGDRLRREADAAHVGGMAVSYTVHTGVMPILDYLAGLPIDSLFGIDIAFKGVDPPALRAKLSPTKCLWTGPSSTFHLWEGPEATRAAVRQVFEVFGTTGLILSPCVSAHSIMPWASTLAMVDEWRRLR